MPAAVIAAIAIATPCVLFLLAAVFVTPSRPGAAGRGGCSEVDHHDRMLPNSYLLRVLTTCVYRIKWGPDFIVLPTTGQNGEHGILEVAIVGDMVVGPVIDSRKSDHPTVGWFWLDTNSREFKDMLSKDEVLAVLKSKGLSLPDALTPVESLPEFPYED